MKKIISVSLTLLVLIGVISGALSVSASAATSLPSSYQDDPYSLMYSTPAKNQGDYGLCWAFAATACAEADAIKNHEAYVHEIDLSEWHLAYFAYFGDRIGTGDSMDLVGTKEYYELGGFDMLAALCLSNGIGFADESVAPYSTFQRAPSISLDPTAMYQREYVIKNVFSYDITSDPDAVKEAIMEYGAVSVSYYGGEEYTNTLFDAYAHYCPDETVEADHAVTIVGWDDDYSRTNFDPANAPDRSGAWLVKNSWGENWGLNGYFWISYEDVTLKGGTVFDVAPAEEVDKIYAHDGGISLQYVQGDAKTECVNLFVMEGDEIISDVSVGVFTEEDTDYTLNIYMNPTSTEVSGKNGFDNLVYTQTGILKNGLNCIELNEEIDVVWGDVLAVSISTDADMMVDSHYETPMGDDTYLISSSTVDNNQSYYRDANGVWYEVNNSDVPWNFRIKLYSRASDKIAPAINEPPFMGSITYGEKVSQSYLNDGWVTDPTTGERVYGFWSYADPDMVPRNLEEVEVIFTPSDRSLYTVIRTTIPANVRSDTPLVYVDLTDRYGNNTAFFAGDTVYLKITVEGNNGLDPTAEGDLRAYYIIQGEGIPMEIHGDSFVIPENAVNKDIIIRVEYDGDDKCYSDTFAECGMYIGESPDAWSDHATSAGDWASWVRITFIVVALLLFGIPAVIAVVGGVVVVAAVVTGVVVAIVFIIKAIKRKKRK